MQDVIVWYQLWPPAAGGDGFEVGREQLVKVGKRTAHLVVGEQVLFGERALNAFEQRGAHRVNVAVGGVLIGGIGGQGFHDGQVGLPPGGQLLHELGLALLHGGVLGDVAGNAAFVLHDLGEVRVGDV